MAVRGVEVGVDRSAPVVSDATVGERTVGDDRLENIHAGTLPALLRIGDQTAVADDETVVDISVPQPNAVPCIRHGQVLQPDPATW